MASARMSASEEWNLALRLHNEGQNLECVSLLNENYDRWGDKKDREDVITFLLKIANLPFPEKKEEKLTQQQKDLLFAILRASLAIARISKAFPDRHNIDSQAFLKHAKKAYEHSGRTLSLTPLEVNTLFLVEAEEKESGLYGLARRSEDLNKVLNREGVKITKGSYLYEYAEDIFNNNVYLVNQLIAAHSLLHLGEEKYKAFISKHEKLYQALTTLYGWGEGNVSDRVEGANQIGNVANEYRTRKEFETVSDILFLAAINYVAHLEKSREPDAVLYRSAIETMTFSFRELWTHFETMPQEELKKQFSNHYLPGLYQEVTFYTGKLLNLAFKYEHDLARWKQITLEFYRHPKIPLAAKHYLFDKTFARLSDITLTGDNKKALLEFMCESMPLKVEEQVGDESEKIKFEQEKIVDWLQKASDQKETPFMREACVKLLAAAQTQIDPRKWDALIRKQMIILLEDAEKLSDLSSLKRFKELLYTIHGTKVRKGAFGEEKREADLALEKAGRVSLLPKAMHALELMTTNDVQARKQLNEAIEAAIALKDYSLMMNIFAAIQAKISQINSDPRIRQALANNVTFILKNSLGLFYNMFYAGSPELADHPAFNAFVDTLKSESSMRAILSIEGQLLPILVDRFIPFLRPEDEKSIEMVGVALTGKIISLQEKHRHFFEYAYYANPVVQAAAPRNIEFTRASAMKDNNLFALDFLAHLKQEKKFSLFGGVDLEAQRLLLCAKILFLTRDVKAAAKEMNLHESFIQPIRERALQVFRTQRKHYELVKWYALVLETLKDLPFKGQFEPFLLQAFSNLEGPKKLEKVFVSSMKDAFKLDDKAVGVLKVAGSNDPGITEWITVCHNAKLRAHEEGAEYKNERGEVASVDSQAKELRTDLPRPSRSSDSE